MANRNANNFYKRKLGATNFNELFPDGVSGTLLGEAPQAQQPQGGFAGLISKLKNSQGGGGIQAGEIKIERNGQVGFIPEGEFNPSTDKRL